MKEVYGIVTLDVSIGIENCEEGMELLKAEEIISSWNLFMNEIRMKKIDGRSVKLTVHNVEFNWNDVVDE